MPHQKVGTKLVPKHNPRMRLELQDYKVTATYKCGRQVTTELLCTPFQAEEIVKELERDTHKPKKVTLQRVK